MTYDWEMLEKTVKSWKRNYRTLLRFLTDNGEYKPVNEIVSKIRVALAVVHECKLLSVNKDDFYGEKVIRLEFFDKVTEQKFTFNVYQAFELKSDSKVIDVEGLFSLLLDEIKTTHTIIAEEIEV